MCIIMTEAHVLWQVCASVWLDVLADRIEGSFIRLNGVKNINLEAAAVKVAIVMKLSLMIFFWLQILSNNLAI